MDLMQFANNEGDQGLRCPLSESMGDVVYVNKQRMLRSDCMNAHADLDVHCPQMYKGLFHALGIIQYFALWGKPKNVCIIWIRLSSKATTDA